MSDGPPGRSDTVVKITYTGLVKDYNSTTIPSVEAFFTAINHCLLQVTFRFRDITLVEGLEQMGLELAGLPNIQQPTAGVISNENVVQFVHCYDFS